jgi:hypothetical protein
MAVYQFSVATAWRSPGNSAGDPGGMTSRRETIYFVEADDITPALEMVKSKRGCQDDVFDIMAVTKYAGDCRVVSRGVQ